MKSKWLNIKSMLISKSILENSINEIRDKKLSQFSSKLCDIYKEKIMIHSLLKKNKDLVTYWNKEKKNIAINKKIDNIIITKNINELYPSSEDDIINFFFYFRNNYSAMIRFIKYIPIERSRMLAKFLCHFFYDNYLNQNKEEEIILLINLLLEEEINKLLSPLCRDFLQDSFLTFLLNELRNTSEISNYIDVILNCLIKDVEDKNSFNCYLNIIYNSKNHYKYYKKENQFFDMENQDETFIDYFDVKRKTKLGFLLFKDNSSSKQSNKRNSEFYSFKNNSNNLKTNKDMRRTTINKSPGFKMKKINELFNKDIQIKKYINKDFFFNINEFYFKALLSSEKDETMKSFYIKQIKILNSSKDKNIFSCHSYFQKMKYRKIISKLAVEQFNKMVETINNFIDKLLTNLEKKEIIPFNIRIICKFIDVHISKKFKNISKTKKNNLICNFLFRILIFPILENPDLSLFIGDMIISSNTRNILHNIYQVLSHLIEGELFNSNDNIYYTIFNNFIIKNHKRINKIIDNIIKIYIPDNYNINKINLNENNLDFIQCKSICFNSNKFLLFYNTIHAFKNEILKGDKYIENIFNNITKKISTIQFNINSYYLITNENIDNFSFRKEEKIRLNNNSKNEDEIYKKIKYAIIYVLDNLQLYLNLENNISTPKTFEIINDYLNHYFKPSLGCVKPPLSWYSQYIVNNINLINKEYKENDFQLLYNELELDLKNILNKYKNLNDYLTINIELKSNLLDRILKTYKNQLKKIRKVEMNIKSLIFIETNEIKICLMKGTEYNHLIKSEKKTMNNNLLIMSNSNICPHNNLNLSKNEKKLIEKRYHCNNIKEYAEIFSEYHKILSEEIMNYSLGHDFYKTKVKKVHDIIKDDIDIETKEKNMISSDSIKEILETYINTIKNIIEEDNLIFLDYNEYSENEKEEIINIIWNYILKSICEPISSEMPLLVDDAFKIRCITLRNIVKPENLDIPKEIIVNNYIMKIGENLKIIDELRAPNEIFKQFGIFIESINSLFKFFLNIRSVEPDELLNIIIYIILISAPERIIFKTNFCKFFLGEDELIGNIGISVAQIESALMFINKLDANQIGISQQEFNNICSKVKIN